jgi:hypothetical protein
VQGSSVPKSVDYLSLKDFIASDLANTSGASTYGKVEWEFEGEKGKFKARKNFLLDITTIDYLYEQTILHLGSQTNKSFIKPELGKMRIAVTGDIWSYFSQAWLNYLTGEVYLQWPGNTLDERIGEQTKRMEEMRKVALDAYALPFDFAAFDHQPQTPETKTLVYKFLIRGQINVPPEDKKEYDLVLGKTTDSFDHSKIIAQLGDKIERYPVQGGLPSGIRLTSLIGNYWNQTMTQISKNWLKEVGMTGELPSWLRGDDSAIYAKTYWGVLAMRLAYAGINAIGNDSKYGIHAGESEFLRVWYGLDKNYGYPNRAIPGLIQRKPWNSEPWDPEGVLKAQLSTIDTLSRRLARQFPELERIVCEDWSRIRKQSVRWLQLPTNLGGLGLLKFEGWTCDISWPRLKHPNITFTNLADRSYEHYQSIFPNWTLTTEELKEVQHSSLVDRTAADDIRGLGSVFRSSYKQALKEMSVAKWYKIDIKTDYLANLPLIADSLARISSHTELSTVITTVGTDFGMYAKHQKWWTEVQELAKIRKIKPVLLLQQFNMNMYVAMKKLERKGLHRGSALDYLFGKISGLSTSPLSPLLVSPIQSALSLSVENWVSSERKWNRETWSWYTSCVASYFAKALDRSKVSQDLFQW